MTSMIRKTFLAVKGGPGAAAVYVEKTLNRLFFDRAPGGVSAPETIRTQKILRTGAGNLTLTAADDGAIVIFDNATSRVVSLPATAAQMEFTFIVETVTAGAGHSIDPTTADKITGNGLALADGVAIECDGATDRAGDMLRLTGDGALGWYVTSVIGTWSGA
jgi:hypothetical protein